MLFNVPKRTAAFIKVWVCMVLILAAVICSFLPIITLDIGENETMESVEKVINDLDLFDGDDFEIPKEVNVSSAKLVGSISLITKAISVAAADDPDEKDVEKLQEMAEGEEGKNTAIIVAAMVASIQDTLKSDDKGDDKGFLGNFINLAVVFFAFIYTLGFALVAPVVYIVVAIIALISALSSLKDPEKGAPKVGRLLIGTITFPMIFILLQAVLPTMHYGIGALMLWILALATVLVNVVITRLTPYSADGVKYLNVAQGVSILGTIGYLIFFFNIIKTGVFNTFITGKWADCAIQAVAAKATETEIVSSGYLVDAILVFVAVLLVMSSTSYFKDNMIRFSATGKKGKDFLIVPAILMLLSCVFPMIVKGSEHYYTNMYDLDAKPAGSFLDGLSESGESALTMALVGAIIVVVAEIAMIVLKNVFSKNYSASDLIEESSEVSAPASSDSSVEAPAPAADEENKDENINII